MIPKSIADIVQADIDALVANAVEEIDQLDFKQVLAINTRDERKEFVSDVCAFANARGGDLIFGIQENAEGRAHAVAPMTFNADEEILRIENIIADSVEPKLFGVRAKAVAYDAGAVLVVRVPRSVQGIHRNKLDERFWVRESRSKRSLDVPALAIRFQGLAERQDKLSEFLAGRYAAVATDQLALPMRPGPKLVIHVFQAFASIDQIINVLPISEVLGLRVPTRPNGLDFRMTYEGPMQHSPIVDGTIRAYTLTHHSGVIEGVSKIADPEQVIHAEAVECTILQYVGDLIPAAIQRLSIDPPFVVRSSIVGGAGAVIQTINANGRWALDAPHPSPINRSALVLPDAMVETGNEDLPTLFRPVFDRLWHAAGYQRSFTYQDRGAGLVWNGRC